MRSHRMLGLASLAAALFLGGCDESVRSPDFQPELDRIEVCAQPQNGVCPTFGCPTSNAVVASGLTQQFCAVGFFTGVNNDDVVIDRTSRDITNDVLWESSVTAVATIDAATGLAEAIATGPTTTISASADGVIGSTLLQVTQAGLRGPGLVDLFIEPPLLNPTVPGVVTPFRCTAQFTDDSCLGSNPVVCDVTNDLEWDSSQPVVGTVGNTAQARIDANAKGVFTAVSAGVTNVSCTAPESDSENNVETARVTVCDAQLLSEPQGLRLQIGDVVVPADQPLTLLREQRLNLSLIGSFRNDDPNCGDVGANFELDLTQSAQWQSQRADVVAVGNTVFLNKGEIRYVSPGLATVNASFGGQTASVDVIAVDARVLELRVDGPQFLFAPGTYDYTATALFELAAGETADSLPPNCEAETQEPAEGEGDPIVSETRFLCDVSQSPDIIWRTQLESGADGAGVADIPNNNGVLGVRADAQPQGLTIAANFRGAAASADAIIVPADLVDVRVNPGLACISSGTLGLGEFIGSARQVQMDADLIFEVQLPGAEAAQQCSVTNSERAAWQLTETSPLSAAGSDILDAVPNLLASLAGLFGAEDVVAGFKPGCLPLLPVTVGGGNDDFLQVPPAFVSNQAGSRGLVTANEEALLGLIPNLTVGTACVSASVTNNAGETVDGSGTVLVAVDLLPEVCSLIQPLTDDLLTDGVPPDLLALLQNLLLGSGNPNDPPTCNDLLEAAAEGGDEATDGESAEAAGLGGLLGQLLGALLGANGR